MMNAKLLGGLLLGLCGAGGLLAQSTIYIDPDYAGGDSDGTIEKPFTSWETALPLVAHSSLEGGDPHDSLLTTEANTYLQKRGTTTTIAHVIELEHQVKLGAYGTGDRPVINFAPGGHSGNVGMIEAFNVDYTNNPLMRDLVVEDLVLNAHGVTSGILFEGMVGDVRVENCEITGSGWGIRLLCWDTDSLNRYLKVLHTTIHLTADDGIYTWWAPNLEVGYCHIYDVNQKYFTGPQPPSQSTAPGDPIQQNGGCSGAWIHHNILDKSGTEFKFPYIANSGNANPPHQITVEYNRLIGQGRNTAACLYLDVGVDAVVRGNVFSNAPGAIFEKSAPGKLVAYNNVFYNVGKALDATAFNFFDFYNNTMIDCGGVEVTDFYYASHMANNLIYRVTDTSSDYLVRCQSSPGAGKFTCDYNLFNQEYPWMTYLGGGYDTLGSWQGAGYGANSVIGDPLMVDVDQMDFRLAPNSPARNAGIAIAGITPDGDDAPDIGAPMDELYATGIGPQGATSLLTTFYGPYEVHSGQCILTDDWLGTLDSIPSAPWLYAWRLRSWIWLPAEQIQPSGAWVYIKN